MQERAVQTRAAIAAALLAASLRAATPAAVAGGDRVTVASNCVRNLAADPGNGAELERLKATLQNIADREERARFCLIYYLGALIYVHEIEAQAVERYVQTRLADTVAGRALQQDCLTPCPNCQMGTVFVTCSSCGGTCVCPTCKGGGVSATRGFDGQPLRCTACGGTTQCRACAGAGGMRKNCGVCGGRGGTRDEARAKTWYALMLKTNGVVRMPSAAERILRTARSGPRWFGFSAGTRDPPAKSPYGQAAAPDLETRRAIVEALAAGKPSGEVLRGVKDVMSPFVVPWSDVVPVFDKSMTTLQREEATARRADQLLQSALRLPGGNGIGYVFVRIRDGVEFSVRDVRTPQAPGERFVVCTLDAPDGISYVVYLQRESRAPLLAAHRGEKFRSAAWHQVFEVADGEINLWGNEIAISQEDLISRILVPPQPLVSR